MSMSVLSVITRSVRVPQNNGFNNLLPQLRHGSSARPGGAPAFNWKEKKILRIATKTAKNDVKLKLFGRTSNIDHIFEPEKVPVDIKTPANGEFVSLFDEIEINDKKRVVVPMLFGSSKPYGIIARKENLTHIVGRSRKDKLNFSHSRIFGKEARRSLFNVDREYSFKKENVE